MREKTTNQQTKVISTISFFILISHSH